MPRIECLGSRLCAAVAATWIVMTAFGSTAFAQQTQTSLPSWQGTFGWTHTCEGGGNRDETHGIADLKLDDDGRGNLTGTLTGSTPQRAQSIPPCTFTHVAPATFSATLVGSYTPGQNAFSVQATSVQTRPGQASFNCSSGSAVAEQGILKSMQVPCSRTRFAISAASQTAV
jgi:hypothetical protein